MRYLLMGGQACVLYGAAEFSRDTDLAVLADPENLRRLATALAALDARVIAVPPFEPAYLQRGHATQFECGEATPAAGMRVDVMATMRNVPPFDVCWARRSTYDLDDLGEVDVLGLEDLVSCKKTRRDKDWPMVRRLVERHYLEPDLEPTAERFRFWLRELRTPALLVECVARARVASPESATVLAELTAQRTVTAVIARGAAETDIIAALADEESRERLADKVYWMPLIRELEALRHAARPRRAGE